MKITSISSENKRLELNDFGLETKGVSPQGRKFALNKDDSAYLVETGEVLLSFQRGDAKRFLDAGEVTHNDVVSLAAGATFDVEHDFNFLPNTVVAKLVATDWVQVYDDTATATTNAAMDTTTVENVSGATETFQIRVQ